ncbi:MAG TPA: group III truncated hemoglobin [Caulobacteraceae bacterium]
MSGPAGLAQARRSAFAEQVRVESGIDEPMIERLVRAFYDKAKVDDLLGPVFAAAISDWEPHLQTMFAFWSSVALMSGRYHGSPMTKHADHEIDSRHFDRWLTLFCETAREACPPLAAERFASHAGRIGESLELRIAAQNGVILEPGERYVRKGDAPSLETGPP